VETLSLSRHEVFYGSFLVDFGWLFLIFLLPTASHLPLKNYLSLPRSFMEQSSKTIDTQELSLNLSKTGLGNAFTSNFVPWS
jgi:hypothetical protein